MLVSTHIPFQVEIKALSVKAVEGFVSFTAQELPALKKKLKSEQQYNADFAYPKSFPAKKLFEKDYDDMFSELFRIQGDIASLR